MPRLSHFPAEARQLDLFVSAGSDVVAGDAQDLMAGPFFSLAKTKRVRPIDFQMGETSILVETRDAGRATSRLKSTINARLSGLQGSTRRHWPSRYTVSRRPRAEANRTLVLTDRISIPSVIWWHLMRRSRSPQAKRPRLARSSLVGIRILRTSSP